MFIAIYGFTLIIFWTLALRIKPENYPNANPDDVWAWQSGKLSDYRRYGAILIIWIILAFINSALGKYAYTHPSTTLKVIYYGMIALDILIIIASLIHIALCAYRRYQWEKQVGIRKIS